MDGETRHGQRAAPDAWMASWPALVLEETQAGGQEGLFEVINRPKVVTRVALTETSHCSLFIMYREFNYSPLLLLGHESNTVCLLESSPALPMA